MIDTVIIRLPIGKFEVLNPCLFKPVLDKDFRKKPFNTSVNNPTAAEQKLDYKPRLTLQKRPYMEGSLIVEFSAPKLLFQNNLDETEEKHFDNLIEKLQKNLRERGVAVIKRNLIDAYIVGFHPSKNIELRGYVSATMAVRDIGKASVARFFDVDQKRYRNQGQVLQYYTKEHALAFYDKIADLNRPNSRAFEKDGTALQKSLFKDIKEWRRLTDIEVLKMEVRLRGKKMNKLLKELGVRLSSVV